MACSGESAAWLVSSVARKERIVCGCLSSRRVKSCCCKPGTGFPDLSVTTTSSEMRRPSPRARTVAPSAGGAPGDGDAPCCGNPGDKKKQKRAIESGACRPCSPHVYDPNREPPHAT